MCTFHYLTICVILISVYKCRGELDNEIGSFEDTSANKTSDTKITEEDVTKKFTIEQLYNEAFLSYLENDYNSCVLLFEKTRQRYQKYKKGIVNCRRKCQTQAKKSKSIFNDYVGEMMFYEKKIKETLCLLHCTHDYEKIHGTASLSLITPELENKFSQLNDYAFAHICYYQVNRYKEAANAIYTYLIRHPGDKMSLRYIDHYLTNPEVKKEDLRDLEAASYIDVYRGAVNAYDNEDYTTAIEEFEKSLKLYLNDYNDCRLYCEGPFDQGWYPELTVAIANHYTYTLQCKQNCTKWLNMINGEYYNDALANHYHYMQFAYYKDRQLPYACSAVASYLLFNPADSTMLDNKKYYSSMPKFKEEYFTPRQEALHYIKRQTSEMRLFQFISEEFITQVESDDEIDSDINRSENVEKDTLFLEYLKTEKNSTKYEMPVSNNFQHNIKIISAEEDLKGRLRYVSKGFLNNKECDILIKMAKIAVVEGDGYSNNKSPHSQFERFEGATIGRLALLAYLGVLDPEPLELLLSVTEAVQAHIMKYFNINEHLYFTFTHLTKRSSLPDSPLNRQDLSHKVHADNCIISSKGNCLRKTPAYVWRDYSAILYLNDDFIGGEFIFTKDRSAKTIEAFVRPRCGRMVAFTADERNLHGVHAVTQGVRYAIALWFTRQDKYLEIERILARAILQRIRKYGSVKRNKTENIPATYEEMLISLFHNDTILQDLLPDW